MAAVSQSVRPAAVAGMFYPGDARTLSAEVDELLGAVERFEPALRLPKALVVPHAGYIYSGPVAAHAYDALRPACGIVKRVVLLGPAHRVPVRGLARPVAAAYATPLGTIPVDAEAAAALQDLSQVVASDQAHALEHSLEVQLPFLQKVLGSFSLVPLAVGRASEEDVGAVLERLWGGPETLIVVSTDLSHYHAYEHARRMDGATVERIARLEPGLTHEQACGATPLNGLLALARRRGLAIELLAACNSGDTAGGKDRVVGYSSFALYEASVPSMEEAGRHALAIARASIEAALAGGTFAPAEAPWLRQRGASFITLTKAGQLRGCIGSLQAARPLGLDIAENARAAAFRDPRFPPVTAEEWRECRVEVSLIGAPKPLRFADEADLLAQIVPGKDGLILEHAGRRGTFLPQVWESIADKREFLAQLVRKAGLPPDTRLARCNVHRYRVAKWKETQ